MAEFLVELYLARGDAAALEHAARRAKRAAEELTGEGRRVRFLRLIFVPEDETCLLLYDAASAAGVRDAVGRAELSFERVVEAVPAPTQRDGLDPRTSDRRRSDGHRTPCDVP